LEALVAGKSSIWIAVWVFPFLLIASVSPIDAQPDSARLNATSINAENRPKNFVLSEDTPISIGHGIAELSTNTEPVDILSYGVHFRIPRYYIETILHNSRERIVDFVLLTLFPEFDGVRSGAEPGRLTEENKIWRWATSPNLVRIATIGGELGNKQLGDHDARVLAAEEHEADHPWQYGLLKASKSVAAQNQDVYFQRPTATYSGFVLTCDRKDTGWRGCRVNIRVSDDLILRYQFHPALIPHWQEINQKMSALLRSFVVKKGQ
jgi:hypothetical protein